MRPLRFFRAAAILALWALQLAASDAKSIRDAFTTLGALDSYLEFPATRQELDLCFANNDQKCISTFRRARAAAALIFDSGRSEALRRTLASLDTACESPDSGATSIWPWQTCRGVVEAFYFFANDAEDRDIVRHLEKLKTPILHNVFVTSNSCTGDWVSNRPDKERWIRFIDSLAFLDKEQVGRQGYKNIFQYAPKPHTGIALLNPQP